MVSSVGPVRNAESQATLQTYAIETSFDKVPQVILMHVNVPDVQFQINLSPALYLQSFLSGVQWKKNEEMWAAKARITASNDNCFLFLVKRENQLHAKS